MRRVIFAFGAAALLAIASFGAAAAGGRGVGDLVPPEQLLAPLGPLCGQNIADYASNTRGYGGGVGPLCAYSVLGLN